MDFTSSTLAARLRDQAKDARPNSKIVRTRALARNLRNGMEVGGRPLIRREIVDMYRKQIIEDWGSAVLAGLYARRMPAGSCRWCLVRVTARVENSRTPKLTPALRQLLGPQCQKCRKASVTKASGRVALVSSARVQRRRFDALVASGEVVARDSRGRVTRLRINDTVEVPVTKFVPQKCACNDCMADYSRRA